MIDLTKGSKIDLRKSTNVNESKDNDLSNIVIGLGWLERQTKKGILGGLFSSSDSSGYDYDLDACALLLENGKLKSNDDVVYYGNKRHKSGKIWSCGDNLIGSSKAESNLLQDSEQIVVNLEGLDAKYDKVVFYVSIYQGKSRGQNFSQIERAFIRAVNNKNNEIARYTISGDSTLSNKCSFVFAEAIRENGTWNFSIVGNALDTDKVSDVANLYK